MQFRVHLYAWIVLLEGFTLTCHRAHGVLVYGAFSNVDAPRTNSPAPILQAASRPVSLWPIACLPVLCEMRFCLSGGSYSLPQPGHSAAEEVTGPGNGQKGQLARAQRQYPPPICCASRGPRAVLFPLKGHPEMSTIFQN